MPREQDTEWLKEYILSQVSETVPTAPSENADSQSELLPLEVPIASEIQSDEPRKRHLGQK